MTRKRRDSNHSDLRDFCRSLGMSWQDTADIPGALDGICGYAGVDVRVEIKDGSKRPSERRLTNNEQQVFDSWKGRKPVIWMDKSDVIRTRLDLLAHANRHQ